jgi:hypothetical protein
MDTLSLIGRFLAAAGWPDTESGNTGKAKGGSSLLFPFLKRKNRGSDKKQNGKGQGIDNSFLNKVEQRPRPNVPDYRKAPHYHGNLKQALQYFGASLGISDDYMVRIFDAAGHKAAIVFMNTICDHQTIEKTIKDIQQHAFPKKKTPGYDTIYDRKRSERIGSTLYDQFI